MPPPIHAPAANGTTTRNGKAGTNGSAAGNGVVGAAHQAEEEGRPEEALALLDEGIRSAPGSAELLALRGALLGRQGRLR
ncbi:MAG TPA: hypothetical protein VN719_14555, partial [Gemmatimonadales bacterium]|nr:hypothetical protein [Gemmatimonadales bacterium]